MMVIAIIYHKTTFALLLHIENKHLLLNSILANVPVCMSGMSLWLLEVFFEIQTMEK